MEMLAQNELMKSILEEGEEGTDADDIDVGAAAVDIDVGIATGDIDVGITTGNIGVYLEAVEEPVFKPRKQKKNVMNNLAFDEALVYIGKY